MLSLLISYIWQVLPRDLVKQLVQCCSTTLVQHLLLNSMTNEGSLGTQQLPPTISLLEAHTLEEIRPARPRQVIQKDGRESSWTAKAIRSKQVTCYRRWSRWPLVDFHCAPANYFLTCYKHQLLMLSATSFWQIQKCSPVQICILCPDA